MSDALDPRSDTTVLAYVGESAIVDVPARDLSASDLARLAHRRGLAEDEASVNQAALRKLRDELVATALYQTNPSKPVEQE